MKIEFTEYLLFLILQPPPEFRRLPHGSHQLLRSIYIVDRFQMLHSFSRPTHQFFCRFDRNGVSRINPIRERSSRGFFLLLRFRFLIF